MKKTVTDRIDSWASLILALLVLILAPCATRAGQLVPLRATWDSEITISPLAPPRVAVSGQGAGHATHLGAMAAQSIAEVVNLATGEGAASYRFIAANGDEVFVEFAFLAIPTSPTGFFVQGVWEITGGTGRYEGATGSGTYEGDVAFTGPANASGSFMLVGTISSVGKLK